MDPDEAFWILEPQDEYGKGGHFSDARDDDPWDPWYDKMFSIVVKATSEDEARRVAQNNDAREMPGDVWTDEKYTRCVRLTEYADSMDGDVLIRDIQHA